MRKILLLLAFVLLPLGLWAQDTAELSQQVEDDKGFITRFLEKNLSGAGRQVLISDFRGALSSRATFAEMTIADENGVWITLRDGAIQWNRSALLRRRIEIAELSAREILLPRMPGGGKTERKAETREFALPDLPVAVNIDKIMAERVELGEPVIGLPAVVSVNGRMHLEGGEGTATLAIDRKDGPRGQFALDAGYSNSSKVLKLDLKLDEDKDGLLVNLVDLYDKPAVKAEISGEGPLSNFLADITLATDGQPRVTGKASATAQAAEDGAPGTAFRLELGGDVASLLPPENRTFFGPNTQLLAEGWRGEDGKLQLPVLMIDTQALNVSGSLTANAEGAPQQAVLLMTLGVDAGATELPVKLPFGKDLRVNDGRLSLQYDAAEGSGWQLEGHVGQVQGQGVTIGALQLDGSGQVALKGDALDEITGLIRFGARGLDFADPALARAVGSEITGKTDFMFAPGNAVELANLTVDGADYGLAGDVLVAGLSGGITVSGAVDARYEALERLSALAGRDLKGRADARVEGLYQVLTRAFDVDAEITGTDIAVAQEQLDRLLSGQSRITLKARRDENGIELSEFDLKAQRLTAEATGFLNSASSDLRARISMPALSDADAQLGGSLEAEAFLNGPAGSRRLTLSGQAQDLQTGIAELDGALRGATNLTAIAAEKDGGYVVERFELANPQIKAQGQGNFAPGQLAADLDLSLPDLAALGRGWSGSLTAKARAEERDGTRFLTLTGEGQELRLGQQNVDGALSGTTKLSLSAEEKDGVVTLRDLDLANQQMTATASGTFGKGVTDLKGKADIASLAAFGTGWRGALTLNGSLHDAGDGARHLAIEGTGENLALGQAQVDGALTGTTRLVVRGVQRGESFTIDEARLLNDQARIEARGRYAPGDTDLSADVAINRLEALGLGWRGSVDAEASFRDDGSGARQLAVEGTAQDLALGQSQVDAALAGPTRLSVRGSERGGVFTIDEARIDNARLDATASGTVGGGATDLQGRVNAADLRFLGNGIAGALSAEGRVTEQNGRRRIVAQGTANGLSVGQPKLDPLLAGQTRFDIAAGQEGQAISVERLSVQNPQLQLSAEGSPQSGLAVDARLADLGLIEPRFPGPATATGTVRESGADFVLDLNLTAPGETAATISGRVARDMGDADLRIAGTSDAAAANPFIRTRSIEGPITFDLRMNGRPGLEALSGRVQLTNGELAEPKLGLRLEALNVTADLNGNRISVDGSGQVSDGGRITLSGPVDLADGTIDIGVTLDGVVLRDPHLYEATVSGNLRMSGVQADGPTISGRIGISEAEIRIPSTGLGGAKSIPDITHVGSQRPPVRATRAKAGLTPFPSADAYAAGMRGPAATPPVNPPKLDLLIDAPNQVFIRGRGVDAEMGGQIRIQGTTRNVMPIGTLELIRGRVDLLGKRFVLTEGLVELQGSLVPVIRLVAETVEGEITTRIIIDGEARDPEITFESSPDLPEEEVLSQLLFGRGLDNISPLQAAQLANAVAVLAGRGGEGIVGKLRNSVGLDDLDLATDDEGNVEVRAGKYLSENLYTDVSVADDGRSKINLNLDITDSLRARGSVASDGESSLGVFFERDY